MFFAFGGLRCVGYLRVDEHEDWIEGRVIGVPEMTGVRIHTTSKEVDASVR